MEFHYPSGRQDPPSPPFIISLVFFFLPQSLKMTSQKISKKKVGSGGRIDFRTSFYDFETSFGHVSTPSLQLYVCYVPFTSYCSCIQKEKGTKIRSRSESNSRPKSGYCSTRSVVHVGLQYYDRNLIFRLDPNKEIRS
jgi:hypothetical protein